MSPLPSFSVPHGALDIDLAADPETRAATLGAALGGFTAEQRAGMLARQEYAVERLRAGGAVYAGHIVDRVDDRLTAGELIVLHDALPITATGLASIGRRLAAQPGRQLVEPVDLPCGAALLVVEDVAVERANAVPRPVRQAQIIVPVPDGGGRVTIAMATQFVVDWGYYMTLLGLVAASLAFRTPESRVSAISATLG